MQDSHTQALKAKHAGIERLIHDEESRPAPDAARIARLKKQKLRIKEEISLH
nr:YdcH family protein [Blastomonas aquatica]